MKERIFHITTNKAWLAAQTQGFYAHDSLSAEGFIHCSTSQQILAVADAFYRGQSGLVLLDIRPNQLQSEIRWEPPAESLPLQMRTNELFPHVYGPINLDAVDQVVDFKPDSRGLFNLPAELEIAQ